MSQSQKDKSGRLTGSGLSVRVCALCLAMLAVISAASAQTVRERPPGQTNGPALVNTCLITEDVKGLVKFYESILQLKARRSGEDYAELHTGVGVLAIFSARAQNQYIPGSAIAANNKGVVLEFRVANLDQEFRRLHPIVNTWVKPPTTQPWGTRSFYFRDPDGNLVDFYSQPATR